MKHRHRDHRDQPRPNRDQKRSVTDRDHRDHRDHPRRGSGALVAVRQHPNHTPNNATATNTSRTT